MTTNILHVRTLAELDADANEARVIAFSKTDTEERLHWTRIAWYLETKAMEQRIRLARRAS